MGRLQPGDNSGRPKPYHYPGPPKTTAKTKKVEVSPMDQQPWHACDKCGYSTTDGRPISQALWKVEVPGGTLYFCGHHFRDHAGFFMEMGYHFYDIREPVGADK